MTTLFETIKASSLKADALGYKRSHGHILLAAQSEMGEIADEVMIIENMSYKEEGPDGVVGESIDAILCLLDLIHRHDPSLTEADLVTIATAKGGKWINKLTKHLKRD